MLTTEGVDFTGDFLLERALFDDDDAEEGVLKNRTANLRLLLELQNSSRTKMSIFGQQQFHSHFHTNGTILVKTIREW